MARKIKCKGVCGILFSKEELILHDNSKYYCKKCLEKFLKDKADREELYNLIGELYNCTYPNGFMLKQISEYINDRKYTYKGIYLTLLYCKKIDKIKNDTGIGIVPYFYDKAKQDYIDRMKRVSNHKDVDFLTITVKGVNRVNKYKENKLIDLEGLLNDL